MNVTNSVAVRAKRLMNSLYVNLDAYEVTYPLPLTFTKDGQEHELLLHQDGTVTRA